MMDNRAWVQWFPLLRTAQLAMAYTPKSSMNTPTKPRFAAIPVIISALVATLLGVIIRSPTSDFVSWLVLAGFAIIPMGFILAFAIQMVRRKQVAYSVFRAVGLGFVVGAVSFGLLVFAMSGCLIEWIYSLV